MVLDANVIVITSLSFAYLHFLNNDKHRKQFRFSKFQVCQY